MSTLYMTGQLSRRGWLLPLNWRVAPVTLAIVTGPVITVVYLLTRSADAEWGSLSLAQALRGILCFLMFLLLFFSRNLRLLGHRLIHPFLFLAMYAIVTCFAVPYPYANIVFAVRLAFVALVFASSFYLAESKLCSELWLTVCAWIVLLFMAISVAIGLWTGNTATMYQSEYATGGLIDRPSVTAALIISALPFFLKCFPKSGVSMAGVIIILISLFFTMRRTEIAAAVAAVLLILLRNMNPFRRCLPWGRILLIVMILVASVAIGLQTRAGMDFLDRVRELDPHEGTGSGRYIFWSISLKHILEREFSAQIFGEGMGSIRDMLYRRIGMAIPAHNAWLDLTHAFGVFGLVGVTWWYWELIRFSGRLHRLRHSTFQGVLSIVVVLLLVSVGQGEFFDPSFALIYAALGFWSGLCTKPF